MYQGRRSIFISAFHVCCRATRQHSEFIAFHNTYCLCRMPRSVWRRCTDLGICLVKIFWHLNSRSRYRKLSSCDTLIIVISYVQLYPIYKLLQNSSAPMCLVKNFFTCSIKGNLTVLKWSFVFFEAYLLP